MMNLPPWIDSPDLERVAEIRSMSLAKLVRNDLLALIVGGRLRPGERINEPDVARRLDVSRVPVREALRELESSGLVVSRKHSGVFVREFSATEIRNLYELRAVLDGLSGRRAAEQDESARAMLTERLDAAMADMRSAAAQEELQGFYRANLEFHWAIVTAAGNPELESSYRSVIQKLHLSRMRNLAQREAMHGSIAEHEAIAAALDTGDADSARALLESHVTDAWSRLNKEAS
jgi:DNA-binding GntR family transcriptional regulator